MADAAEKPMTAEELRAMFRGLAANNPLLERVRDFPIQGGIPESGRG